MTDALAPGDELAALAAEYVLGVLDMAERAVVERRLRTETALAALVAKWEMDFAGMNGGFAEVKPPNLLPAIEERLFGKPATARRSSGASGWLVRFLGGAGLAGALAILLIALLPPPVPPVHDGAVLTATLAAEGQPLVYNARYDAGAGELIVARAGGEAAPAGQVHELWLIAGDAAPVSLGLVDTAEVRRPLAALPEGAVLAISLEPAGGSTTGAPTGPVLVTGVVATSL